MAQGFRRKALALAIIAIAASGSPAAISERFTRPHDPVAEFEKTAATRASARQAYGRLPLRFEVNQGQTDSQVKFISRGAGYMLFLTSTEAVLAFDATTPKTVDDRSMLERDRSRSVVRMQFVGANPHPGIEALNPLSGASNYLIGRDPKHWRTHVPGYARVRYSKVYPAIDLLYYGNQSQLEYDFLVAPGGDPDAIAFSLSGADRLDVGADGDLLIHVGDRQIELRRPFAYQTVGGVRREIASGYRLDQRRQVHFQLASYDRTKLLVIDPVLVYSTFLGGTGIDVPIRIAVDAAGSAYVTGITASADFPVSPGALQGAFAGGGLDSFVAKLSSNGSSLEYSTYLVAGVRTKPTVMPSIPPATRTSSGKPSRQVPRRRHHVFRPFRRRSALTVKRPTRKARTSS